MTTCKDCIHYPICSFLGVARYDNFDYEYQNTTCIGFKDKSQFIELPSSKSLQEVLNNLKPISHEDIEMTLKQMETADDIVGCTIKWVIENSNIEEI